MVGLAHGRPGSEERKLPPISEIAVTTMVLVVIGGVFMAAHMPKEVPLALPIAFQDRLLAVLHKYGRM